VLVDSEPIHVRLESELLSELGWPLTPEEVADRFLGRTAAEMAREIEERIPDLPPGWEAAFEQRAREAFERDLRAVDGVVEALDRISIPTCVASSGTHEKMRLTLSLTGLWDRFEGRIFSAADVEQGKPAPDLFLHAAKEMGAEPVACAVVEDSPFGVQAAHAAGMKAFAYAGGIMPTEKLASADVIFDDMRELPRLLSEAGGSGIRLRARRGPGPARPAQQLRGPSERSP
jgi:HAD superfamily hydrolase (TIGR01509 family)